jgi:hypothetical protein
MTRVLDIPVSDSLMRGEMLRDFGEADTVLHEAPISGKYQRKESYRRECFFCGKPVSAHGDYCDECYKSFVQ